jgi:uncharacterized LabA/DUF88 family protein
MGIRSDLQNQLRRLLNSDIIKGKVSVQRAYADWRRYPQYIVPLSESSIDLIFAPAFGANKKNATDIRLAIDALELVFTRPEIGVFILLSGDSDFSALVLKLKEYAKYVIGVGIRESSSDLLIQNCDEYFSYSELTGLSKEGEIEHIRRDPWELVVEAVRRMGADGDVMRSDRLKQVMQGLDPNFDERDAGYNRFSKFVVAAGQRGLLALTRMENGQYAVELGSNANVPTPEQELSVAAAKDAAEKPRRRAVRKPAERAQSAHLTLSESFELLRKSLLSLEAVAERSTDAERARNKMAELLGSDADPLFDRRRFPRMLRQAHDAGLIELIKGEDEGYMLKLSESAAAAAESGRVAPTKPELSGEAPDAAEDKPAKKKRTTKRRTSTARSTKAKKAEAEATDVEAPTELVSDAEGQPVAKKRPTKRRTTTRRSTQAKKADTANEETAMATATVAEEVEQKGTAESKDQADSRVGHTAKAAKRTAKRTRPSAKRSSRSQTRTSSKTGESPSEDTTQAHDASRAFDGESRSSANGAEIMPKRNPRFRGGSRGQARRSKPAAETTSDAATGPEASPAPPPKYTNERRTLGARKGSRGRKAPPADTTSAPQSEPTRSVTEPKPTEADRVPVREKRQVKQAPDRTPVVEDESGSGGGFFKRMSAAFQRAVQGDDASD